ncbi:MAG: SlyX family protein [Gammaproteobacteria bacterium]|nr:SlyX family protein [Gammaproteobacteria bacterium]
MAIILAERLPDHYPTIVRYHSSLDQWQPERSGTMESRMENLEFKISHQEVAIDELTESVLRQQRMITTLQNEVQRLKQQLTLITTGFSDSTAVEPPPPHY